MARLIDAKRLERQVKLAFKDSNPYVMGQLLRWIRMQPTVDAVEVVRCKDCKYCRTFFPIKEIGKEAIQVWFCDLYRCNRKVDEFCSDGERR